MEKTEITFVSEPQEVSMGDGWFSHVSADHFWISWRFRTIKSELAKLIKPTSKIMEIGCGNSCFRNAVQKEFNVPVDGCDLNEYALKLGEKGQGELFIYDIYLKDERFKEKYDVIFLLDVIEHIDKEEKFLEACTYMLKPGGKLIVNVPAYMFLYSPYDKLVGHYRRYSPAQLENLMQKANYKGNKLIAWGSFLMPVAIVRKMFFFFYRNEDKIIEKGIKPGNPLVNFILQTLKVLETSFPIKFPFGTSCFCIGEKPNAK